MSAEIGRDVHLPSEADAFAAAVVLHPHPGMGGDRHHPLVVAVAEGLAGAGVAAARIDLADPDPTLSVRVLESAALSLAAEVGTGRVVLVGYSWGSAVSSWAAPPGLVGRVLVAPPVSSMTLGPDDGRPLLALVPAHDQFGPPADVAATLDGRQGATVEIVEGCDHFLVGAVSRIATRAVEWTLDQL